MKQKHQRLVFILIGLTCLGTAVGIILNNFNDNLVFFYSPSQLHEKQLDPNKPIRVGGLVQEGTIEKSEDGQNHKFNITDMKKSITVEYKGILPPMFREGQGMVAKGTLKGDVFVADNLLTKHDEQYMPPEVAKALKKSGQWREEYK